MGARTRQAQRTANHHPPLVAEYDFTHGSPQWTYIRDALRAVDRRATPFVLVGIVVLHLVSLHQHGSSNPTGIEAKGPQDKIPFHPYYTSKDFFGFGVFFIIFAAFVFFAPNYLGHPDNYTPANPMVTPSHIVPEWYFLPFYAILRAIVFDIPMWLPGLGLVAIAGGLASRWLMTGQLTLTRKLQCAGLLLFGALLGVSGGVIPSKLAGVLAMFGSIGILFVLPWLDTSPVRSANYRPIYKWTFWIFGINALVLGYCGSQPPEGIFPLLSLFCTAYYFGHFLVIMPLVGRIEKPLPLPTSIGVPVTKHAHHH